MALQSQRKKYIYVTSESATHHANREVVVDDAVRHRVAPLVLVGGRDVDLPAVQHYLATVLDVTQDLEQALALVASMKGKGHSVYPSV